MEAIHQRKVKLCKEKGCKNSSTTAGYCRFHYLKNWKEIKELERRRAVKNLNRYIDHIMQQNPDSYIDTLKSDLRDEEQFTTKAESYFFEEDFRDVLEDLADDDINRIVEGIKIDDSF